MRPAPRSLLGSALCLLLSAQLGACALDEGKGPEEGALDNYEDKSDSFRTPTEHGTLVFGLPQGAALTDDEHFHAWDFELEGDATVSLATKLLTDNLDTVMYLYKQDPATGSFGRFKFKNDDADPDTLASELVKELGAGTYRVLVKGHKTSLRGSFLVSAECEGPGCSSPDATCDVNSEAGLPTAGSESCGQLVSDALNGEVISGSGASVTVDERCSLPRPASLAVEFYKSYWDDIAGFEDMFQFDPNEPIVLDVDWEELSNGSFYVGVDGGGDEAAMDFLMDADGELIAHYQHNQSPDFMLYCEGGIGFGDEDCGIDYMRNMPHDPSDERSGTRTVDASDAETELEGAALLAYQTYASELGLAADKKVVVEFTIWGGVGRVTLGASGQPSHEYELGAGDFDSYLYTAKRGGEERSFECKEL